jgi:hypothetical protein
LEVVTAGDEAGEEDARPPRGRIREARLATVLAGRR